MLSVAILSLKKETLIKYALLISVYKKTYIMQGGVIILVNNVGL